MKKEIITYTIVSIFLLTFFSACKKLLQEGTPKNQLTSDKVFKDSTVAKAALVNIYAQFDKAVYPNFNKWTSLYTDELTFSGADPSTLEFYKGNLSVSNTLVKTSWTNYYYVIYSCNDYISRINQTNQIPSAKINQYTGEAKFLRAFAYFNLLNTYGNIPLLLTTDVNENSRAFQSDSLKVYAQISSDLKDAQNLLSANYADGGKVRANKWAAISLLAKVSLYQHDWGMAENLSSSVIQSNLYSLTPLTSVFLANSDETILQIWTQNGFVADATTIIPSSGTPIYPISTYLLSAFESGDQRKTSWLKSVAVSGNTYYYPYKYHNRTTNSATPEYLMAFRLAEQYLIRAEARAQQGKISEAIGDINVIRQRAGLPALSPNISSGDCIKAIYQEWRIEFFTEWAHRYFDLKRVGSLNNTMAAIKSTWTVKSMWFPIPSTEITYDFNLKQNPGY